MDAKKMLKKILSNALWLIIVFAVLIIMMLLVVMPLAIGITLLESGSGFYFILGILVTIIGIAVLYYDSRWFSKGHEEAELREWRELAKNPRYSPGVTEVERDICGKSPEQIQWYAKIKAKEMKEGSLFPFKLLLKEWQELAKNPKYKPHVSIILDDIEGKKPEEIRKLAIGKIKEIEEEMKED